MRVTDDAEQSYSEDGRALMLICLCPGASSLGARVGPARPAAAARAPSLRTR